MYLFSTNVAEGEGFEPPETLQPQWFSRPPQSTTLPSLHLGSTRHFSKSTTESQLRNVKAYGRMIMCIY